MRVTHLAKYKLEEFLNPGDWAIDATVGNGHDTLFMAQRVGGTGHVLGVDIQPSAIESANQRLVESQVHKNVTLHCIGHEALLKVTPTEWVGGVAVVMFNLGYRPHGDKSIITLADTTLAGLEASLKLLKNEGVLSIMAYPDHEGGAQEASAVAHWVGELDEKYFSILESVKPSRGPMWWLVQKKVIT